MNEIAFTQWLQEGGQVVVSRRLLEHLQGLNLTPEHLGSLVLAMAKSQQNLDREELARDPWVRWSLSQGWATWQGEANSVPCL